MDVFRIRIGVELARSERSAQKIVSRQANFVVGIDEVIDDVAGLVNYIDSRYRQCIVLADRRTGVVPALLIQVVRQPLVSPVRRAERHRCTDVRIGQDQVVQTVDVFLRFLFQARIEQFWPIVAQKQAKYIPSLRIGRS